MHHAVFRVLHGYGNIHGVSKMGNTGMATVLDFGTLRHTVPVPWCHGYSRVLVCFYMYFYIYYFAREGVDKKDRSLKLQQMQQVVVFAFVSCPSQSTANARPFGHHLTYSWVSGKD